jgi:hypothetical protein
MERQRRSVPPLSESRWKERLDNHCVDGLDWVGDDSENIE